MKLIDEIKARLEHDPPGQDSSCRACELLDHLRAALMAGGLMANRIRNDYEPGHPAWAEMERFRAATEGTPPWQPLGETVQQPKPTYAWSGSGPEPRKWTAPDGTLVYRSYGDYCDD